MAYEQFLFNVAEWYWSRSARNLQKRIGPSGLAHPCDSCLGHQILGHKKRRERGDGWLTFLGTCLHNGMESALKAYNADIGRERFLVEQRVTVGTVGSQEISGSLDAYDTDEDVVIDWKLVGDKTLMRAPAETYLGQIDCYGMGALNMGLTPKKTLIMYLPRNQRFMWLGKPVLRDWDRPHAEAVIHRADRIAQIVEGNPSAVEWLNRRYDCWDCKSGWTE